jgi:hypothetical protein
MANQETLQSSIQKEPNVERGNVKTIKFLKKVTLEKLEPTHVNLSNLRYK